MLVLGAAHRFAERYGSGLLRTRLALCRSRIGGALVAPLKVGDAALDQLGVARRAFPYAGAF